MRGGAGSIDDGAAEEAGRRRWYDDACGTAHALELVGERWALLVVREMLVGPRRFGELRAGLPGITAAVLARRLEGLEAAGIVHRRTLPSPANAQVYGLTPWGLEIEPAIQALGRWAARSPTHDPSLPLSAIAIAISFRTLFSPERAAGIAGTIGVRFGRDAFVARLGPDGFTIGRGDPEGRDAFVETDPATLAGIVYGGRPLADAEGAGALRLAGDRALVERFARLFVLPEKAPAPV